MLAVCCSFQAISRMPGRKKATNVTRLDLGAGGQWPGMQSGTYCRPAASRSVQRAAGLGAAISMPASVGSHRLGSLALDELLRQVGWQSGLQQSERDRNPTHTPAPPNLPGRLPTFPAGLDKKLLQHCLPPTLAVVAMHLSLMHSLHASVLNNSTAGALQQIQRPLAACSCITALLSAVDYQL